MSQLSRRSAFGVSQKSFAGSADDGDGLAASSSAGSAMAGERNPFVETESVLCVARLVPR